MAVPKYDELMNPTLQALKRLGGKADIRAIEKEVADILNLSTDDISEIHREPTTKLVYRLAWSRNYLKRFGILNRLERGIWALTDEGRSTDIVDIEEVKSKVRSLGKSELEIQEEIDTEIEDEKNLSVTSTADSADIESENESSGEIIRPFDPKLIDITSKTMILDAIFKRLSRKEINLFTDFQRQGDLWDSTKQSRLIESVLIRFPLPAFYFDGSNDSYWLVVDGLQRISSFKNFVVDKNLQLQNLEFLTQFNGFTFDELPRDLQRRIEESEITVYIINPGTPDEVKYNIFKRINTGGLVLEPQEIRHALNQGIPASFVAELARVDAFKIATDYRINPDRMLDREFATRFLAFYLNDYNDYKPDLDSYMNKAMAYIKKLDEGTRADIKYRFKESLNLSKVIFGKWTFRKLYNVSERRKPINKALFEVWSVCLAKLNDFERDIVKASRKKVFNDFIYLMNNDARFNDAITSSTGDKSRVIYRYSRVESILQNIINT